MYLSFFISGPTEIRTRVSGFKVHCANQLHYGTLKKNGVGWRRSIYLAHAKRALYHLSYNPFHLFRKKVCQKSPGTFLEKRCAKNLYAPFF